MLNAADPEAFALHLKVQTMPLPDFEGPEEAFLYEMPNSTRPESASILERLTTLSVGKKSVPSVTPTTSTFAVGYDTPRAIPETPETL